MYFYFTKLGSWEDRILISHEHNITTSVYIIVMLNGNGWATSSEITAASLLLDLEIDVWLHQRNVYSKNTFIPCNLNFYTFHLFLLDKGGGFGISFSGMFRVLN
jgi:hypothetical protein